MAATDDRLGLRASASSRPPSRPRSSATASARSWTARSSRTSRPCSRRTASPGTSSGSCGSGRGQAGIYGPQLPKHLGGLGLDWRGVAVTFEEAGTSLLGPLALNCAAPDEGNMHLLENVATPEQKAEVPGAAGGRADPLLLRHDRAGPRRRRRPDDAPEPRPPGRRRLGHRRPQVVHHRRDGAAFAIVMVRTSDDPDARRGATMFLVDAGTPGFEIVRHVPSLDQTFPGGHCEVRFTNCRVPSERHPRRGRLRVRLRPVAAGAGPPDPLHALARGRAAVAGDRRRARRHRGPAAARRSASTRWSRRCWPTRRSTWTPPAC